MIIKTWRHTWPHLRAIIFTLTFIGFSVQFLLFSNRETLFSAYTPITENALYCQAPNIINFQHHGNGQVSLWFDGVSELSIIDNAYKANINREKQLLRVELSLLEGFNNIHFSLDGKVKTWSAMYTSPETYAKDGNALANSGGAIGLYPSEICMGNSVIPLEKWSPTTTTTTTTDLWKTVFVEAIQHLEGLRGIPDSATENASFTVLVDHLDKKTSQGWCSQIAVYNVAKLDGLIPVRLVSSGAVWKDDNSVRTGGHTFLEYFDRTHQRWAFSDPTSYVFSVRDTKGIPLNTIEFSRILSFLDDAPLNSLGFEVVDPVTGKIAAVKFNQLPQLIQRDLRFYFRPQNQIMYMSGDSSVYSKKSFDRIKDWTNIDKRFLLSSQRKNVSIAEIRVISFWLTIFTTISLLLGEFYWRLVFLAKLNNR